MNINAKLTSALRILAVVALTSILVVFVFFASKLGNDFAAMSILVSVFVGIFGSMRILNPNVFSANDEFSI